MRISELIAGGAAGWAATVPMTAAMGWLYRRLPPEQQCPLPPSQITARLEEEGGIREQLTPGEHAALTLGAHFGYGAAAGALFAPLARALPLPPVASGLAFGLAVWGGSYLGLLPALGLQRPATESPAPRNALMIAAHLVWGATAGALLNQWWRR
jgi:hypothetical protein